MIRQRNDNHVQEGLDLLTEQFKGKPVTEGLLTAFLERTQLQEADLWQLLWGWVLEWVDPNNPSNIYHASGQQLDDLGAIVGQPREGRSDSDYVAAIKLRARINRSHGTSADMIDVIALISAVATYVEYFPLAWEVSLYNVNNGGDIIRLLKDAKAATSYGVLLTSNWPEANVFKFDHAGSNTYVIGSIYSVSPDVRFPAALPTSPPYRLS